MFYRLFLVLLFVLGVSPVLFADGFAYGNRFSPQLLETQQLTVIKSYATTTDFSRSFATEGMPAVQLITAIYPFWYKVEGLALMGGGAQQSRNSNITPIPAMEKRMRRIATRQCSRELLTMAPFVGLGLSSLVFMTFDDSLPYELSNPGEDISVRILKQSKSAPWRLQVVDFFSSPGISLLFCLILYLLSWFAASWFIIYKRWQRAGMPGNLFLHILSTFLKAQFIALIVVCAIYYIIPRFIGTTYVFPTTPPFTHNEWRDISVELFIIAGLLTVAVLTARKAIPASHKWFSLINWLVTFLIITFVACIIIFVFHLISVTSVDLPAQVSRLIVWSSFPLLIFVIGCLLTAALLLARKVTTDWRKWLTLTSWLCSSLIFNVMVVILYGFLHWCESV